LRVTTSRPKKIRQRGVEEPRNPNSIRRGGNKVQCGHCKKFGHNQRSCEARQRLEERRACVRQFYRDNTTTEWNLDMVRELFSLLMQSLLYAYCLAYYFLTLVFIILLQLDESSTTTSGNCGRGRVNTPRSGGRSGGRGGGLNTPRSGGRSGGVDTQSQHATIPPKPAPEPAIYEIE
jgi:hypothetical protein